MPLLLDFLNLFGDVLLRRVAGKNSAEARVGLEVATARAWALSRTANMYTELLDAMTFREARQST